MPHPAFTPDERHLIENLTSRRAEELRSAWLGGHLILCAVLAAIAAWHGSVATMLGVLAVVYLFRLYEDWLWRRRWRDVLRSVFAKYAAACEEPPAADQPSGSKS